MRNNGIQMKPGRRVGQKPFKRQVIYRPPGQGDVSEQVAPVAKVSERSTYAKLRCLTS